MNHITGLKKKLAQALRNGSEYLLIQEAKAEKKKSEVIINIIEPIPIRAMNSKFPCPVEKSRKVLLVLRCSCRELIAGIPVGIGFGDKYIISSPFSFSKSPAWGNRSYLLLSTWVLHPCFLCSCGGSERNGCFGRKKRRII